MKVRKIGAAQTEIAIKIICFCEGSGRPLLLHLHPPQYQPILQLPNPVLPLARSLHASPLQCPRGIPLLHPLRLPPAVSGGCWDTQPSPVHRLAAEYPVNVAILTLVLSLTRNHSMLWCPLQWCWARMLLVSQLVPSAI